ncbi:MULTISPECIES: RIP metalloprotease RseP [Caballeronia]|jgi:regulator of sigma E protease|uniref:Zinc metalloprotease n=1 Tax=Caballeronia zhejiangensis TaxID=871203 RepID=A0A656QI85_9BURK|nr:MULTISPECIES: RIP metalloprotease RseP [Caballeronia]EKS67999.1 membrane-associated zinc metalloprotease [Burkholderia sp. SJ98]KDR29831.1 zinc metalloprotease [Caballeronia zhejiangensis]MDR5792835.1 RIP metalloprotease RseP [Caballeronia sp. LZ008]
MNFLTEIVAFVVAIGVLVVVHEFGHYSVARLCGVKVLRFSVGFGKPLVRWVSKKTGVEWTIAALPLGGYVKMLDEREVDPESGTTIPAEDLPRAFNRQNVGKRIAIVAAGPIANFLLAIVLFSAVFAGGVTEPAAIVSQPASDTAAAQAGFEGGETILSMRDAEGGETHPIRSWSDLRWKMLDASFDHRRIVLTAKTHDGTFDFPVTVTGITDSEADQDFMDKLGFTPGGGTLTVAGVEAGSAAQKSGLKAGDMLRAIDGRSVDNATSFIDYVKAHGGKPVTLVVERNGQRDSVQIVPDVKRDASTGKDIGRIGAALANQLPTVDVRYGPLESLRLGVNRTWDISVYSLRMFGRMITGEASLKNLSGPVTIADYAGKSARLGATAFISFLALVSISLGVLNLLPIPVLDGGHLLYYLVEAVTGKAVSDRWQLVLQRAGLVCIVALSMIALFNDLARLIRF